jgi:hypothetical protein
MPARTTQLWCICKENADVMEHGGVFYKIKIGIQVGHIFSCIKSLFCNIFTVLYENFIQSGTVFVANCLDSRLRGNDGRLGEIVIPAKAGIQESMPELIEKLQN